MKKFYKVREMFAVAIGDVVHLAGTILSLTEAEFSDHAHQVEEVPDDVAAELGLKHPEQAAPAAPVPAPASVAQFEDGTPVTAHALALRANPDADKGPQSTALVAPPVVAQNSSVATPGTLKANETTETYPASPEIPDKLPADLHVAE